MSRPYRKRVISHTNQLFYKPAGVKLNKVEIIELKADEYEAIRLADFENLSHEEGGKKMDVSRPTFGRILEKARNKIADALIHGKALKITSDGPVTLELAGHICEECGSNWKSTNAYEEKCPECEG